jgi:hypothetical protein
VCPEETAAADVALEALPSTRRRSEPPKASDVSGARIEAGQRWERADGSGEALLVNGHVEGGNEHDWDVTLLPSGARLMRTSDFIIGGYRLV